MNLNNLCMDDLLDIYYEVRKDFKDACLKGDANLIERVRENFYMVRNEFRRREVMRLEKMDKVKKFDGLGREVNEDD